MEDLWLRAVVGRPIITNVMAGFNSCVLAYGATSSGVVPVLPAAKPNCCCED